MIAPVAKPSEQALIGAALKGQKSVIDVMSEKLTSDHFYGEGHREIVEIILKLNSQNLPIDYITVEDEVNRINKGYLHTWLIDCASRVEAWDEIPTAHHIAKIVQAQAARQLIELCQETLERFSKLPDWEETITRHVSRMARIEGEQPQETTFTARQVGEMLKSQIKASQINPGGMVGLPTGFDKLNSLTGGFRNGELIIVAARPGVGKSVVAGQVLMASPYEPSALITLEMTAPEIFARMTAAQSGTELNQIRSGKFESAYDESKTMQSVAHLQDCPLFFEDCSTITIAGLRSKIRRLHSKHGIRIAVVDYLQLVSATPGNRAREIGEISRGLKSLAKELNIPIIALAQLNRAAAESDEPGLHHLRDSGEIEQDADIVILLHRLPPTDDQKRTHIFPTLIKVAKQRNGPCVAFMATLQGATSKFTSPEKAS